MNAARTALLLIGFQNDYFAEDGLLRQVPEDPEAIPRVLKNTLNLLEKIHSLPATIVSTPILFTPNYDELVAPAGILKTIQVLGAFRRGTRGAETIAEFARYAPAISEIPGKRGLNAFHETRLQEFLISQGIETVVLAGVVTSLCIESTGRSAYEQGFKVIILSDCTGGRTSFEQKFYCEQIFPLYAEVMDSLSLLANLKV